jgi:hypothetical protein
MMTLRGPVLVGTDLSPKADEALRQGARLATETRRRLTLGSTAASVIEAAHAQCS